MPNIVEQPHGSGVMTLNSEQQGRLKVRCGQNKWQHEVRDQIDVTWIGGKRFYTDDAINRYLRRQTVKARPKLCARQLEPPMMGHNGGSPLEATVPPKTHLNSDAEKPPAKFKPARAAPSKPARGKRKPKPGSKNVRSDAANRPTDAP